MNEFCNRLKLVRKSHGLSQEKFAALGGVTRDTQMNYENGSRKPDSEYLANLQTAGVDVIFLFTGEETAASLDADEVELVAGYRKLDVRGKARLLGVLDGMTDSAVEPASTSEKKTSVVFHGKVGQQITGDITAPQTIHVGGRKKK